MQYRIGDSTNLRSAMVDVLLYADAMLVLRSQYLVVSAAADFARKILLQVGRYPRHALPLCEDLRVFLRFWSSKLPRLHTVDIRCCCNLFFSSIQHSLSGAGLVAPSTCIHPLTRSSIHPSPWSQI